MSRNSIYDADTTGQQALFEEYKAPVWEMEWAGMPEFTQTAKEPFAELIVRFGTEYDFEEFQRLIGQKVNSPKSSIWHPKLVRGMTSHYRWQADPPRHPKYPIFIISKGRYDVGKMSSWHLNDMGVDHYVVVEPQEEALYKAHMPWAKVITTPFSNLGQGSIPVRNFCNDVARGLGAKRHWVVDDNIQGWYRLHKNQKIRVADGTCFRILEDMADRYTNVPMAGFNYDFFCKAMDPLPPFYLNDRIYSCILLETDSGFQWRGKYNEDTDLSLRILKSGKCTILLNSFLAGKAHTQTMKGGNTDEVYADTNDRMEFAQSLKDQHPDVVEIVHKFGRWHHQVNYKPFKKNTLEHIAGYMPEEGSNNYNLRLIEKDQYEG